MDTYTDFKTRITELFEEYKAVKKAFLTKKVELFKPHYQNLRVIFSKKN